jgi:hypothetical protein
MEQKVSDEEILNEFIENDKKLNEQYKLESLDKKSQIILLKYKFEEVSMILNLLFNNQSINQKEE